jgi:UDP-glucose 4-epimerase
MKEHNVKDLVFSSSATVYGTPEYLPLDEKHPVGGCTNPYGKTKYFIEEILTDISKADEVGHLPVIVFFHDGWSIATCYNEL